MINKTQLKEIINDLIEVCKETEVFCFRKENPEGFVTLNTIFSEACQYHRRLMIEANRKDYYSNKQYPKKETFTPITDAQLKFLKFNDKKLRDKGFDVDNIQSKQDAHKVIKQFKEL